MKTKTIRNPPRFRLQCAILSLLVALILSSIQFNNSAFEAIASDNIGAPTNFAITDMGGYSVNITWAKGVSANQTLIKMLRDEYTTAPDEGEEVYFDTGTEVVLHGLAIETTNYTFSAWSYLSGNYSDNYTTASIGGEGELGMEELAAAIEGISAVVSSGLSISLTDMTELVMTLVIMLGLATLAYWRGDKPLFMLSGLGFIIYGFAFFPTSFYFSILMVLAGIFLFIRAFTKRGIVT